MTEPTPSDDLEYRPVWARDAARKAARRDAPSFKRLIVNLIAVAAVAAVVAFFAVPVVAFFGIRDAARFSDAAGLARLIDYPAVRSSLRPQIAGRPEIQSPAPSFLEDPIGAVRRQFEDHPISGRPSVDPYLTPQGLLTLTRGEGRDIGRSDAVHCISDCGAPPMPRPVYWSVNRARLSVSLEGQTTVFTFERRGPYEWKLVHVGLPEEPATLP